MNRFKTPHHHPRSRRVHSDEIHRNAVRVCLFRLNFASSRAFQNSQKYMRCGRTMALGHRAVFLPVIRHLWRRM